MRRKDTPARLRPTLVLVIGLFALSVFIPTAPLIIPHQAPGAPQGYPPQPYPGQAYPAYPPQAPPVDPLWIAFSGMNMPATGGTLPIDFTQHYSQRGIGRERDDGC